MLSDRSRPVIQETLPVIADHIEEIARRFSPAAVAEAYEQLFTRLMERKAAQA